MNAKSLIQSLETLPVELIGTHYDIWFIDYEEGDGGLFFREKNTYKSLFTYICIVINKIYVISTWSNNSHTIKEKKTFLLHCVFIYISLYIISDYKIYCVTL